MASKICYNRNIIVSGVFSGVKTGFFRIISLTKAHRTKVRVRGAHDGRKRDYVFAFFSSHGNPIEVIGELVEEKIAAAG
jgi:hypothetical protein